MVLTVIERFLVTEDFFELIFKFLYYVGLWPYENLSATNYKLYKIYEITLHCCMIIYLIITGIKITEHSDDFFVILSNIDISIVSYNFFLKVISFVAKREKLKTLVDDIMMHRDKVTDENRNKMIKLLVLITFLYSLIPSSLSLAALYNNEMVVNTWMPFDPYKNKMNLIYATQILISLYLVPFLYRAVGMEGIVCNLFIYMCDQLEQLQTKIRNLVYTKENETIMREELRSIIRKHIRLLGYSKSMESMFKEYFLVQNLAVTLELCLNAVIVTTINLNQISVLFGFLSYLGLAIFNAYVYSYIGTDLIEKSNDIAQAAYDSDWTAWPVDLQKQMLLIMKVAQRPFTISAGGLTVINMQSFMMALYNAYSIFAVLNDAVD